MENLKGGVSVERLTTIDGMGSNECVKCFGCETAGEGLEHCGYCEHWQAILDKLAAYEDTGLTPERCAELAETDKDGRLVVLPCKVGDTVYFAAWFGTRPHIVKRIAEEYFYTVDEQTHESTADFFLRDVGKTVFLTREEAERALKEGTQNEG